MTKKIFNSMLAVSTAVLLVCVVSITFLLYNYFTNIVKSEIKAEAIKIAQHVDDLEEYRIHMDVMTYRVTLIDSDGSVLFDTDIDENKMENHADREEIIEASSEGEAYSERFSDTLDSKTIYYAVALEDGKILRVAQEQSTVVRLFRGIFAPVLLIFLVVVLMASLISKFVARRLVEPINEIDLNSDEAEEPYPELAPFMKKIRVQNKHIASQIEELRKKQKEFSAITEHMNEGFLLLDKNTEILSYNKAAIQLLNHISEAVPVKVFELNRSKNFRIAVEGAISGRHTEIPFETDNGVYNIIANPVTSDAGVEGVVILIVDETEKEQREKLRREFTSNVSHELKTPLTTIYGVSDMITEGIVKPEDIAGFALNIREESGRMISLIDDIIKLSKLDESPMIEDIVELDLMIIAEEVLSRLAFKAQNKNVKTSLTGESVVIRGNRILCNEIIYNLCENGIKYNKDNGRLDVHITQKDGIAVITVDDTGIGIPYEYRERIFERFFRGDKSRSQKIDGTGLGLSIVKHAVLQMNGSLEVNSVVSKGTKMIVKLPL